MKTQKDNTRCCLESGTPHTHDGTEIQPKHTPTPWFVKEDEAFPRIYGKVGSTLGNFCVGTFNLSEDTAYIVSVVNSHDELVEFAEMVSRSACDSQYLSTTCICFSCKAKRLLAKIGRKQ